MKSFLYVGKGVVSCDGVVNALVFFGRWQETGGAVQVILAGWQKESSRRSMVVLKVFKRAVVLVVVLKEPSDFWVIDLPDASSDDDRVELEVAFEVCWRQF